MTLKIDPSDRTILRDLAHRKAELAHGAINNQRRDRWFSHNDMVGGGPMILAETCGLLQSGELAFDLKCREEWARAMEKSLRFEIAEREIVDDDVVMEPCINIGWRVNIGDFGVKAEYHHGSTEGHMGSYVWDPPIKDLQRDMDKLHFREASVDRDATLNLKAACEAVFDSILPVRIRGQYWWTAGLTWTAITLIGLENLMVFMYDDPEGLHRLMAFLRDDQMRLGEWLQREGLLCLNNENDGIGSGGRGHTTKLPQAGGNGRVRMKDLWVLSESQETVGVGPEQFEEFIFPYQLPICEQYGLTYYGCCEPLHSRWHVVKRIPNLRKVSISPWCDERFMAEQLGRKYSYCRKPNPALVSGEIFDEDAIRKDIRGTLDIAKGCHVELVMKDVHTVMRQPERLRRWVQIAREEAGRRQ